MLGDSYDKAKGYLDAVATPEMFGHLDAKDYVQLAIAYALLEIAATLDESVESLDMVAGRLSDIDTTLVQGLLNR